MTRAQWVHRTSDSSWLVGGERHRIRIWKTKVAYKDDKHVDAFVHTSNGVLVPAGYDRARDVLEMGLGLGAVKQSGATVSALGHRWRGMSRAVIALPRARGLLAQLDAECKGAK